MYFLRKTFELAVCLLGYWVGKGFGGWEWLAQNVFARQEQPSAGKHFFFGATSTILVIGAAYVLWGK